MKRKATDPKRAFIINEFTDGRMLNIIIQHYEAGHALRYNHVTDILVFTQGFHTVSLCRLNQWFAPETVDYVIDLILPQL